MLLNYIFERFLIIQNFLKISFIFNWRIIALQYYVGFCQTLTWISPRCTYIPSLLILLSISHPSRWLQSPSLSSLSHIAYSHWLFILYMVLYRCPCDSLHFCHPILPPLTLCPQSVSLCLHLHCCPVNRIISTIFLDSIYMH